MNYVLYKILYFFKKFQVSLKQIEFPSTRSPPSDPKKFYFVEFYLPFKKKKEMATKYHFDRNPLRSSGRYLYGGRFQLNYTLLGVV